MATGYWIIAALLVIMGLVLLLPFLYKKVEEELEIFLLLMGVLSVSIDGFWTGRLVLSALEEPVKISLAVLVAGLLFRAVRPRIKHWTHTTIARVGYGPFIFLFVTGLGLASSVITAIIAALVLAEVVTIIKFDREYEIRLVIITCFAIGLGAVLTPLGEPLATIAVAKLKGAPHHAGFFYLLRLLGVWVIPAIAGLGLWAALLRPGRPHAPETLKEDRPEKIVDIVYRAFKVYLFVMALVLLGKGFTPLVEKFLLALPPSALYWINSVSAVLDNATLTAAELDPRMSAETIRYLLLGLLISGGMLIPGNIPNIICAGKLSIRSKAWAKFGLPLGLALMAVYFIALLWLGRI